MTSQSDHFQKSTCAMNNSFKATFVTWNLGSPNPNYELLSPAISIFCSSQSDIIAFSLEEICDTSLMINSKVDREYEKLETIFSLLMKPNYCLKFGLNYGTMLLFVYVKEDSKISYEIIGDPKYILHIREDGQPLSKASVSVTQNINGRTFTFIGNHLECYDENYKYRCEEWSDICNKMLGSDYTILFGDLNFRVEINRDEVLEIIKQGNFEKLLEKDQLDRAKRENPQFQIFKENKITFPPTYKFNEDSDEYDTVKYRIPSYTDRVLYATENGVPEPKCIQYTSVHNRFSDHRPVVATYEF